MIHGMTKNLGSLNLLQTLPYADITLENYTRLETGFNKNIYIYIYIYIYILYMNELKINFIALWIRRNS